MQVLDQFSFNRTELGLSELARLSGLDKAATRRLLVALSKHGFIEQLSDTRKYRLGTGFIRLARIREATLPLTSAAQEVVDWILDCTGETTHISVPTNSSMATLAHRLPNRGNIININPAEPLPYHATSSGLCYLSMASSETQERIMALKRTKSTPNTITTKADLLKKIQQTRSDGYAQTQSTFEEGVASIAKAFFLDQADPSGTVSIALPIERMTDVRREELLLILKQAVNRIEKALRG